MAYAAELRRQELQFSSAGVRAVVGGPVHPKAATALEELGGDPSNFAARQLTPRIATNADMVVTMTTAHRDAVLEVAPTLLRRTFTLAEAAWLSTNCGASTVHDLSMQRAHVPRPELTDIADPIGEKLEVFRSTGAEIASLLRPVIQFCTRQL